MTQENEHALTLLRDLTEQRFWGVLTLKFQRGQIVHVTKEESIQLVPNNRRPHNDAHSR